MKYYISILMIFCLTLSLAGQDSYHQYLLNQMEDDYNLLDPSFVFNDNEQQNLNDVISYGNSTFQNYSISGEVFSEVNTITVNAVGNNPWDSGWGIVSEKTIQQDDVVLITFFAKKNSENTSLLFFIEDNNTFEKEAYSEIAFSNEWKQYFVAFKASKNYSIGNLKAGFHLAGATQSFDIAGFTALNFDTNYDLNEIPSDFSADKYGGFEEDAIWRAPAQDRIEEFRMADLNVIVKNQQGESIEGAKVLIDMTKHDFEFGTAVVACRFPGNDCFNQTYVTKLFNLDNEGHGFNSFVTENALKWDAWEEQWIGSPAETKAAVKYIADLDYEIRGHTLLWPGWQFMPDDIQQNQSNETYIKERIDERLESMLQDEILSEYIKEWDVLNEIAVNRDLEYAMEKFDSYTTGREIYIDIFNKVQELKPNNINYINDYVTLSYGGSSLSILNNYKEFVTEINDSNAKLHGIGFQAHIGPIPTSIYKVENTLNEFDELFDVDMKVTEYDINDKVSPETQAAYMNDFLTMIFSHEKMNGFIMWGFWDGNHWLGNAAMYDLDWNLKPSGEAFNNLVFNEWWTDIDANTDQNGEVVSRVFKGDHQIRVEIDGVIVATENISITDNETVEITTGPVSNKSIEYNSFTVIPNPNNGLFEIDFYDLSRIQIVEIYNSIGQLVYQTEHLSNKYIEANLNNGIYTLHLKVDKTNYIGSFMVQK